VTFIIPGNRPCHILVTNLTQGQWYAQRQGSTEARDLAVSEDSGAAWFEGPAGVWTLSH
jgi:hypothetical protein